MKDIKEALNQQVGPILKNEGFSYNKSKQSFKKKLGKNSVECFFIFNDYAPIEYQFKLVTYAHIFEIENLTKNISSDIFHYFPTCPASLILSLGDFIPAEGGEGFLILGAKNLYTHYKISTKSDLMGSLIHLEGLLQNNLIPAINMMFNIQGIELFFLSKPTDWAIRTINPCNMISNLISSKHSLERNFQQVLQGMKIDADRIFEKEIGAQYCHLFDVVENLLSHPTNL